MLDARNVMYIFIFNFIILQIINKIQHIIGNINMICINMIKIVYYTIIYVQSRYFVKTDIRTF